MKYLIISDIHGSYYYAKKIVEIEKREKPDYIILLGDLYYHGPRNDLTQEYNPMEVSKILNVYADKIRAVRGNCDAEVDEMISNFHFTDNLLLEIDGKRVFFAHGHQYNIDRLPKEKIDVMIYGHFHTGFIEKENNIVFANSGSISLPKNGTKHSYLILENKKLILKDVDGSIIEEAEI